MSIKSWIRSARTLICIHRSNSMQRGILFHQFQVVRPKPCQSNSIRSQVGSPVIYIWQREEGMELGNICCLTCWVPYYPEKLYGVCAPRPWSRIKSSISVEWHQMWHVVHCSHCSQSASRQVWEGFQHSMPSSQSLSTREHQHQVWKLPQLPRPDLPNGRRPALLVAHLKKMRWKNIPARSTT